MEIIKIPHGRELVIYSESEKIKCSQCGVRAVVPLTPRQLSEQPDNTSYVCHPGLGGCNLGYERVPIASCYAKDVDLWDPTGDLRRRGLLEIRSDDDA